MKVEVVLDIACVWSYLGYTRFARAVEHHRAECGAVEVVFRPFQVDPDADPRGEPLLEVLRRNFGADVETKKTQFAVLAARDGLQMSFDEAVHPNTFDAHRLVAQAGDQGLGEQMVARLFRACHTDGRNVGDPQTLAELAAQVGVSGSGTGAERTREDLARIHRSGITGVPVFRFPGGHSLFGAQPEHALRRALSDPGRPANSGSPG